ncbi:DNA-binding protein [Streptomyces sp. NPDC006510]|uniref:DNA-binding protein n=1 Tax=Streptomyces sp. NPDC006510 TaxID=3155600 RepID=UPI0033B914D6
MIDPAEQTTTGPSRYAPGARELLEAGAVLPPGTEGAAERAVPLTARAYRHPGLEGRTVVRLVAAELGAAEDRAAGYLGLAPQGEPTEVGLGLRQALGFPEWVLAHHPQDGHRALDVVPELDRAAQQARSRPKAAVDAFLELAGRLAVSVPHFLPTFFEQAGRVFLGVDNPTYAAQMFTRARKAEAEHGLRIDEKRLDEVFLEFALAGVLPVKALSGYARELPARVPAEDALRRFVRMCVRRTAGGLPPSAQTAADLRRLAKAAGQDADAVEQAYLTELLGLPATPRAATGWWKAHRRALVALARREPGVRGTLLNVMPQGEDRELPGLWLEILEESGAAAGLADEELPEEERPADGTVGWLQRFTDLRVADWSWASRRLPLLYTLVERSVGRLRAELAASGRELAMAAHDLDLLDVLLSLKVPVDAEPTAGHLATGRRSVLELWAKAEGDGQRDLLALAADPRFRAALRSAAGRIASDPARARHLTMSPGGRLVAAEWVSEAARRASAAGLPGTREAVGRLTSLSGELLALAGREVSAVTGLTGELVRTLRAGLFDEFGWPAWEEAVRDLVGERDLQRLVIVDAWPYLVVAGPSQVRVIGAEGTVLRHDLRIPADDLDGGPGFHFVDGELLVHWHSREHQGLRGYWHTRPDDPQPLEGGPGVRRPRPGHVTVPLPAGGRATGAGVLNRGDTAVPGERKVITDGTSLWVWDGSDPGRWREHDPYTGEDGQDGMPGFFSDTLHAGPDRVLHGQGSWLRPAPGGEATPAGVPVGGLLGWCVVRLPDGSWHGRDLAGRTVTVDGGDQPPFGALTFLGDDRPRALAVRRTGRKLRTVVLTDPDGTVTSTAWSPWPGEFAAGTRMLPPTDYWHCLRPRDPQGSAALRRVDRDTAAALMKAARSKDKAELPTTLRALLPQLSHEALLAGVTGVVRYAAAQQAALDQMAARLARALPADHREEQPTGPAEAPTGGHRAGPSKAIADQVLGEALNGLIGPEHRVLFWPHQAHGAHRQIQSIRRMLQDTPATDATGQAARLHLDGPDLPHAHLPWETLLDQCPAVAFRAAAPTTGPDHREALCALLHELDTLGTAAADPPRWRRFSLHLDRADVSDRQGGRTSQGPVGPVGQTLRRRGILPLDSGAFIAVVGLKASGTGCEYTALFHDPTGRFSVPAPYTVLSSAPLGGDLETGRLAAFLAELSRRGPAPWRPQAAAEFARLTGVSPALARLVVAGMPHVDRDDTLPPEVRATLEVKVSEAWDARSELRLLDAAFRRDIVAALMPARPADLWTNGPDAVAAAEVWNARLGWRVSAHQDLLAEADRAVRTAWEPSRALPALLSPASAPELSRDLTWAVERHRFRPVEKKTPGFDAAVLVGSVALAAWLSHRLPAGDPVRAALPTALAAVRDRLACPGLVLDLNGYSDLPEFRRAAGAPSEVGEGWERYGAVVMPTHDACPSPAVRPALLDAAGTDPFLPVLRRGDWPPFPVEVALRLARDARFEAALADPGDPVAGERDGDGMWWPQDPTRSVPELVAEAAKEHGLGEDVVAVYLMVLAMPDPTDRNTARWTGWKPARLKAARAELAATGLVVEATRTRAGRSLFLPGGWTALKAPHAPLERWKLPLVGDLVAKANTPLDVIAPTEPAADLYRRAWQRVRDGDAPRFEELKVPPQRRR